MSQNDGSDGGHREDPSGFHHERDPRCSYFEEMSRRCASVDDTNTDSGRRMECKLLRKLLRRCPGKPVEEVERIEETTSDDSDAGLREFGFSMGNQMRPSAPSQTPSQGSEGHRQVDPFDRFGDFERSPGFMDPFELMQRGFDEMFHELGRELFRPFKESHGEWPGAHPDIPPHYRHRYSRPQGDSPCQEQEAYEQDRMRRRHWDSYKSEDV
mmetsp:Transcript_12979/g.25180  ORF Transcript_12979/g.25180 Transcript_12979/m.25180 type:complete len:212 (-) Transcript_12979:498-1133(-)|eukprot:CAMPEP_0171490996 /NCGR_PEP_ID=MMETSP0958-20121227/3617_1 /TAXON_ID=87120 /ORGANISM="Aurantiochytrium limacinum, Strain ATCCMYA-1381" /LENGTH=211 /DNA_ID=CAMNT_0012024371 /DNA_START=23 /DNA_END=658 /DNA_ORIENTATION=-